MVETSAANKPRSTRKAVIPAAGQGTRFLPATKAVPKELLPVVDKPALEYIVEESAAAGLDDVLLVTGRGKSAMVDHFDRRPDLEQSLEEKGKTKELNAVRRSSEIASISTCRQGEPKGLGHAVLCGATHVGNEPFAVMLGDDLIDARDPILPTMLDIQAEHGGIVLALLEVPREHINRYGIVAVESTGRTGDGAHLGDIVRVASMVEKPEPDDAPSNLAIIGRYVLPPEIFDAIRETKPGAGGEIQLTDAMASLLADGTPVHGVVFQGRRYDTGAKIDYLKATVLLGVDHEDLGSEFKEWLVDYVRNDLA
ncbi:UTP--glucose-1-phosphate uridylyltransferase [Cryptosporangium sp. NPDC051539]|uniref:UTP--glucose-1-phosphate uridylyltransferase n=1 Tax=Cryptosporangium sp. NPDC051539 TaxID=3363962 RepID=UPI0037A3B59C